MIREKTEMILGGVKYIGLKCDDGWFQFYREGTVDSDKVDLSGDYDFSVSKRGTKFFPNANSSDDDDCWTTEEEFIRQQKLLAFT